jgi:hypothetical protein
MKSLLQTVQHNLRGTVLSTVALLAFLMLGSGQVSAQTYQTSTQAVATIDATLPGLTSAPTKSGGSQAGTLTNTGASKDLAVSDNSTDLIVTILYLTEVKSELAGGQQDVGAVIENVYSLFSSNTNGRPTTHIDNARIYAKNLLKA